MDRTDIKVKMQELAERAQKRRVARTSAKPANDTVLENRMFNDLEAHIYKNIIVRSDCQ